MIKPTSPSRARFSSASALRLVGLAGYAAFTIATSFYIGYMALGVGYIVARAMKFGSGGLGGRPFQIVAVIFTYLAIALAEIPIALWQVRAHIPSGRMLVVAIRLLPIGLTSPIREMRDPIHGLINLVILFVGLRIAWRGTAAPKRHRRRALPPETSGKLNRIACVSARNCSDLSGRTAPGPIPITSPIGNPL